MRGRLGYVSDKSVKACECHQQLFLLIITQLAVLTVGLAQHTARWTRSFGCLSQAGYT
jgi:hypothetical protein